MSPVQGVGLFVVDRQGLHDGKIVEREQAGVIVPGQVDVLVPRPGRHAENVVLLPVEALPGDDRIPPALGHVIDHIAGMAVCTGRLPGP